jgi:hypothetical protein
MNNLLLDLYGYQAWADAEHSRALEAQPGALEDSAICSRLRYYRHTQRGFLYVVQATMLSFPRLQDFPTIASLKDYARSYHSETLEFTRRASDSEIDRTVAIPDSKTHQ